MVNGTERRRYPRADINWPVTIETTGSILKSSTKKISIEGVSVYCEQTPDPGDLIDLIIEPPRKSPMKLKAEVIWISKVTPKGMGVRFAKISKGDRKFIAGAVKNLLK